MRTLLVALLLSTAAAAQTAYLPERVYDTSRKAFTDFESMLADVVKADVVFVGEQHNDPNTHRLELALLEGVARRRGAVAVGFEMFERDVQDPFDHFQMGHLDEAEFLKDARPWPNYKADYKPLVDYAVSRNWLMFASNVPRTLASEVSKSGPDALKSKSAEQQKWFAQDRKCPVGDNYYKRFAEAMTGHSGDSKAPASSAAPAMPKVDVGKFYEAQCLKDETMGESVAQAFAAGSIGGKQPLVVHFNGSFHSDFRDGTADRARRRLPGKRIVVLSILPVENLDTLSPDKDERKRADYLIYTVKK